MNYDLDAPLSELKALAGNRFSLEFETVAAGGRELKILQIADMDRHLESLAESAGPAEGIELPFWAKIWPASLVLAHFLNRIEPQGKSLLEIGAGVGVTGLFAAAFGFNTVISDINEDALLFARINILENGLEDKARIARADFASDRLGERFDLIVGAEVLYRPDTYRGLSKFLLNHLKTGPDSEALLARNYSRKNEKFFKTAEQDFRIAEKTIGCKAGNGEESERHLISVHRLKPRKHA